MTFVPKSYEKEKQTEEVKVTKKENKLNNELPEIKVTTLPSAFKPYSKNSTIKYNPYTFGEIKKYSDSRMSSRDRIDFILSGIYTSFDKYKLTHSDFLWLALLRKLATFGVNRFTIMYNCPGCNKPSSITFNDDDIAFDDLEIPKLPIILTLSSGQELHFSPITLHDYFEIENNLDDFIFIMASQVRNIDKKKAYDIISNIKDPNDMTNINTIDNMLYHGIKSLKCKCKNKLENNTLCNTVTNVGVDEEGTLILPFREEKESKRNSIRFGI